MKNILIIFVFVLQITNGFAYIDDLEDDNEIIVPLITGTKLVPVYLAHFENHTQDLSAGYITKLEKVLHFDLNVNGMTQCVDEQKANYIIKVDVTDEGAVASVTSPAGEWSKVTSPVILNGMDGYDRRQIHMIADNIHKTLFGKKGVASSKILYTLRQKVPGKLEWTSDIWESDYDGANQRQVLLDEGYCVTPQYVPPEKGKIPGNFVYVSYKTGQPKIYIASVKGGPTQRLSLLRGNQLMPTLSTQRDKVAFVSDVTGNPDLFMTDFSPAQGAVGKPRQIFAAHLSTQGTPTFSPDGKKVAFVSNKDGSPRIYLMDIPDPGAKVKDLKPQLITKFRRGCTAPAWSPDGRKIAYCARMNGIRQIYVYDLKTKKELQLTQGAMNKENPTWAPNSVHLMYNASNDSRSDLYLINLNFPKAIKVTSGVGEKRFPSWEP